MTLLEIDVCLELDRFDLELALDLDRPVTGLFGPSGSGKTSLLEVVAGLRRPTRGRVRLGDETWVEIGAGSKDRGGDVFVPPERRRIGYVPQEGLLFPHWSVRRNLLAGARRARIEGRDPESELAPVVELLELGSLLERGVATLSGGERQRVALGRALCSGPRLLLLDEPLAALDLPLRRRLLPFLRRVRRELTVPMLLVSHDPLEVQALCDDVAVLRRGRVVARGAPRRVLADPDVFALAPGESFENLLPGVLRRTPEGGRRVCFSAGSSALGVPETITISAGPGDEPADGDVLLGLSSDDILLATTPPEGVSACNILPAEVEEIRAFDGRALVHVRLAPWLPPVVVEVTGGTPERLGLAPGRAVHVIAKATACRLYGAEQGSPT